MTVTKDLSCGNACVCFSITGPRRRQALVRSWHCSNTGKETLTLLRYSKRDFETAKFSSYGLTQLFIHYPEVSRFLHDSFIGFFSCFRVLERTIYTFIVCVHMHMSNVIALMCSSTVCKLGLWEGEAEDLAFFFTSIIDVPFTFWCFGSFHKSR